MEKILVHNHENQGFNADQQRWQPNGDVVVCHFRAAGDFGFEDAEDELHRGQVVSRFEAD
jgi:hypothetical protein